MRGGEPVAPDRTEGQGTGARRIRVRCPGPRRGQFFAQLSRNLRPGSTVILTVGEQPFLLARGGLGVEPRPAQEQAIIAAIARRSGMRIEARDSAGAPVRRPLSARRRADRDRCRGGALRLRGAGKIAVRSPR